jgi:RNA polymerase sigma factor (sigma-70 family)
VSHEPLLRTLAPRVLGVVARRFGDFAAAEDAVQEALLAAATRWPEQGVPENPRAWLIQVATRKMTDQVRAEIARRRRETALATSEAEDERLVPPPDGDAAFERDDTLLLLFMCCHPALTHASAIALTLRAVGGLTTAEIARAFLVPEATMAQRISRAKATIQASGEGFRDPDESARDQRLTAVLHVLYLTFNEGYASSAGESLARVDLSTEAIRLARAVHRFVPDNPEVTGLLALMLLTDARRAARTGPDGDIIPLDEQDRTLWDRPLIDEGIALVARALARGTVGSYQLQAAIAAVHDQAPSFDDTDWPQILSLYSLLEKMSENPMVSLNRAVALAMVRGPKAGLSELYGLARDPRLAEHHRLAAVRAHLHERAGDRVAATAGYRKAATLTASMPERNYLLLKAGRLEQAMDDGSRERGNGRD